jgi:tRNA(fMet)-specific endonuclease VapC
VTEPRFLLDSNICIYHLKGASAPLATRLVEQLDEVAVSAIAYAEVMLGVAEGSGVEAQAARHFFEQVPVVSFDRAAADAYARQSFRGARFDRLIAAHALALGATLVTANEGDFADIKGLDLENWTR